MGEVISEKCFRHMCPQRSLISFLCFAHKSLYAQTHLPSRNAQRPHRIRLPCFCFPFLNIFCSFCCYFVMNVNCMWLFVCRVGWLDDFAFCILIHIRFGVFNMLYTRNKCIALLYRFFLCLSSPPSSCYTRFSSIFPFLRAAYAAFPSKSAYTCRDQLNECLPQHFANQSLALYFGFGFSSFGFFSVLFLVLVAQFDYVSLFISVALLTVDTVDNHFHTNDYCY